MSSCHLTLRGRTSDMHIAERRLVSRPFLAFGASRDSDTPSQGADRVKGAYAYRTLAEYVENRLIG